MLDSNCADPCGNAAPGEKNKMLLETHEAQSLMLPLPIPQEFDPNQYCSLETMYAEGQTDSESQPLVHSLTLM
jgi:hypothetical protein